MVMKVKLCDDMAILITLFVILVIIGLLILFLVLQIQWFFLLVLQKIKHSMNYELQKN